MQAFPVVHAWRFYQIGGAQLARKADVLIAVNESVHALLLVLGCPVFPGTGSKPRRFNLRNCQS